MKKITLFLILQIAAAALFAQPHEPVDPQKDKIDFEGYTIKIIPSQGGSYGYDIFNGPELVVHQTMNPFTMAPIGLDKKEDVFKVAQWQVAQLKKDNAGGNSIPGIIQPEPINANAPGLRPVPIKKEARYNQPIPKKVAQELNIQINTPFTPKN